MATPRTRSNTARARQAYDSILYYRGRFNLTDARSEDIEVRLDLLRLALFGKCRANGENVRLRDALNSLLQTHVLNAINGKLKKLRAAPFYRAPEVQETPGQLEFKPDPFLES